MWNSTDVLCMFSWRPTDVSSVWVCVCSELYGIECYIKF